MLHRKTDLARSGTTHLSSGLKPSEAASLVSKQQLLAYLQEHTGTLLNVLRMYVSRAGLASGEQVPAVTMEILQETVVEALAHADRYRRDSQPMAWLLGIALNMIRRRKATNARRAMREISLAI